jgi:hypothetical protein
VLRTGSGLAATTNRIAPGTSQLEHASAYSTLGAQMPLFSLAPYLPWCKWQALSAAAATILMPCMLESELQLRIVQQLSHRRWQMLIVDCRTQLNAIEPIFGPNTV